MHDMLINLDSVILLEDCHPWAQWETLVFPTSYLLLFAFFVFAIPVRVLFFHSSVFSSSPEVFPLNGFNETFYLLFCLLSLTFNCFYFS